MNPAGRLWDALHFPTPKPAKRKCRINKDISLLGKGLLYRKPWAATPGNAQGTLNAVGMAAKTGSQYIALLDPANAG